MSSKIHRVERNKVQNRATLSIIFFWEDKEYTNEHVWCGLIGVKHGRRISKKLAMLVASGGKKIEYMGAVVSCMPCIAITAYPLYLLNLYMKYLFQMIVVILKRVSFCPQIGETKYTYTALLQDEKCSVPWERRRWNYVLLARKSW